MLIRCNKNKAIRIDFKNIIAACFANAQYIIRHFLMSLYPSNIYFYKLSIIFSLDSHFLLLSSFVFTHLLNMFTSVKYPLIEAVIIRYF